MGRKRGSGAVQREVERLTDSGLIIIDGEPRRIHANHASALLDELATIFAKTGGVVDELRRMLSPLAREVFKAGRASRLAPARARES